MNISPLVFNLGIIAVTSVIAVDSADAGMQLVWRAPFYAAADSYDSANSLAVADDGFIYVAGSTTVPTTNGVSKQVSLLLKYDAAGNLEWQQTYAAEEWHTYSAMATHVVVASNDQIIVAGATNNQEDFFVLSYDAEGLLQWSRVYQADSFYLTQPSDLEVDASGNIYLAGTAGVFDISEDISIAHIVKYNAAGQQQWALPYQGPQGTGAAVQDITLASNGDVVVAGSANMAGLGSQFAVWRLNAASQQQWIYTAGSTSAYTGDKANCVAIDSGGNVIAAGDFGHNSAAGPDAATVKLSASGQHLWTRTYDDPYGGAGGYSADGLRALTLLSDDSIVVAGYSEVGNGDSDMLVIRYDTAGMTQWQQYLRGDGNEYDWTRTMIADTTDHIYVAGEVWRTTGGDQFGTYKLSPEGTPVWSAFDPTAHGTTLGVEAIALAADGDVIVTGEIHQPEFTNDIVTIRYGETILADISGDGVVNVTDLPQVISSWGPCGGDSCPADIAPAPDGDGQVNIVDLLMVINNWN